MKRPDPRTCLRHRVQALDAPVGAVDHLLSYALQALILLSVLAFALETLPGLDAWQRRLLAGFEVVVVAVFTAEYLCRLIAARRPLGYVFSVYGLIDLVAILPFYLAPGVDLRSLRVLRVLRFFLILKFLRFHRAIERYRRAFAAVRDELLLFGIVVMLILFLAAVGIYHFESGVQPERFGSVFHCLWWAVATLTTVGYGDVYPVTIGGQVFTTVILFLGLGAVAVPSGLLASALTTSARERADDAKTPTDENDKPTETAP